jgi:hypothetical protein
MKLYNLLSESPRFDFNYDGDDEKWDKTHADYQKFLKDQKANPERYKKRYIGFLKFLIKHPFDTKIHIDHLDETGEISDEEGIDMSKKDKAFAIGLHQTENSIDLRFYFAPPDPKYLDEKRYMICNFTELEKSFMSAILNLADKFDLPKSPNHVWAECGTREDALSYKWSDLIIFSNGELVDRGFVAFPPGEIVERPGSDV